MSTSPPNLPGDDNGASKLPMGSASPNKKGIWYYISPKKNLVRWASISIRSPFWMAAAATGFLLFIAIVTFGSGKFKFSPPSDKDWNVDDVTSRRVDAVDEAEELMGEIKAVRVREADFDQASWSFAYKSKTGANLLTAENIAKMREIENYVTGHPNYTDYCKLVYDYSGSNLPPRCERPTTFLNFFYPSSDGAGNPVYDGQGEQMADVQATLAMLASNLYDYGFYFGKGFGPDNLVSSVARSYYPFGGPLPNYSSVTDEPVDQMIEVRDNCQEKITNDLMDFFGMSAPFLSTKYRDSSVAGDMEVMWVSNAIMNAEFEETAMGDFMWATFSIMAVWAYMAFHTSSFMLATVGMFEIVIAFPVGFFMYRLIFQVSYFATVHLLIIFVVLGIGADDVFVFVDCYKQSRLDPVYGDSIDHRLYYTVKRASKAIFMTSATTCFAFLATAISDIMPISSFGLWAACVIVVLFFINCLVLPPFLVIWAKYFERYACCCCCPCVGGVCAREIEDVEAASRAGPVAENNVSSPTTAPDLDYAERASSQRKQIDPERYEHEGDIPVENMRRVERFFNTTWTTAMSKGRYVVIFVFAALFILGTVLALGLEPPTEEERWFPNDHMFQKWINLVTDNPFLASADEPTIEVHLLWGIDDMDTSGKDPWDPTDRGEIRWDDGFASMTWGPTEQTWLASVCGMARDAPCNAAGCAEEYGKMLVRAREGKCFTEGFADYLAANSLPALGSLTNDQFLDNLFAYSQLDSTEFRYPAQIGFVPEEGAPETARPTLKFVQFVFNSTFSLVLEDDTKSVITAWARFAEELNADAELRGAPGLSRGFTSGGSQWAWAQTEQKLVSNALQGMSICFVMALVVLNISTGNWILSIYATLTILGIVASVLGIGVAGIVQWDFGISESISSVILIGFSVDYCVHLAGAYVESHRHTSFDRMQDALTHMGISVSAGCVSTLLSGAILWACTLTFFTKFAFLIVSTIAFSYVWSIGFFAAMCFAIGPQGGAGEWKPIIDRIRGRKPPAAAGETS